MKFYDDFNSMFNAQSGLKKDMSVFNEIDASDDYGLFRHFQIIDPIGGYLCASIECSYLPERSEYDNNPEYRKYRDFDGSWKDSKNHCSYDDLLDSAFTDDRVPFSLHSLRIYGYDEDHRGWYGKYRHVIDDVGKQFASQHGGKFCNFTDRYGYYIDFSKERYSEMPELARELAKKLDAALFSKQYDLTNPIKEKFWMPVD